MELGLFQLENLFQNPSRFLFLDLRHPRAGAESINDLLMKARAVDKERVLALLSEEKIPKDHPIVLMCEDGRASARVASELESAGYQQVYVVTGGVTGLLSEV